ncbi:MAG: hypothetical protein HY911_04245 [Desulfobacterales bacterium]|nr:hypothetical protein [Desulfobacterales bacterium]
MVDALTVFSDSIVPETPVILVNPVALGQREESTAIAGALGLGHKKDVTMGQELRGLGVGLFFNGVKDLIETRFERGKNYGSFHSSPRWKHQKLIYQLLYPTSYTFSTGPTISRPLLYLGFGNPKKDPWL